MMSSNENNAEAKNQADSSLNTIETKDEEQIMHAPQEATSTQRPSVRFAVPRDVIGEKISFPGTSHDQVSTEGIVDYGGKDITGITGDPVEQRTTQRGSSLELRKQIPDSFLFHDEDAIEDDMKGSVPVAPERNKGGKYGDFLDKR